MAAGFYKDMYDLARDRGFPGTREEYIDFVCGKYADMNDHTRLFNRDAPNQHPITSITGLQQELDDLNEKLTVSNGWYSVSILEPNFTTPNTVASTSEDRYYSIPFPEPLDITKGLWEFRLDVLGLNNPATIDAPSAYRCLDICIYNSAEGIDKTGGRNWLYELFNTGLTSGGKFGTLTADAIIQKGGAIIAAEGQKNLKFVQETSRNAEEGSFAKPVDMIGVRVKTGKAAYVSYGIILRYRRISE